MDSWHDMEKCNLIGIVKPTKQTKSNRPFNAHIIQNFILIWLHSEIEEINDNEIHNSITELRRIVNTVIRFTDIDECIDAITNIEDEKVLMIISHESDENIVSVKKLTQQWSKVKDIFSSISSIGGALKQDSQKCDHDSMPISIISTHIEKLNENLNQFETTFMYTQILKEILLTINFNQQHLEDFTNYCRENFVDNAVQLKIIKEFEKDYSNHSPIWWNTQESCLYSILSRAV
ncbi:unnamed protein product [Rotaria sp. Silwood1]|nr:unnamed protein product [Rotaria sp. Silwood1]